MSLLLSVVGFAAQLFVICSVVSAVVSCVSQPRVGIAAYDDDLDATLVNTSNSYTDEDGSHGMSCLIVNEVAANDLSRSTVKELRALAKERGLKSLSGLRKAELIAAITDSYLFN